jgi:2-amino-4-hydroxy-6-hydroxymethyldihydropteridine diphosphokinase
MQTSYLLLGSNLGDKERHLHSACNLINTCAGVISDHSSIYQTEPWGFDSTDVFFNQALKIETNLKPGKLLTTLLKIENELGRQRNGNCGYSSRVIDIDILLYANQIIRTKALSLPHPKLHIRRFALMPLWEIAPDLIHPVFIKSVFQLLNECDDQLYVRLVKHYETGKTIETNEIL